MPNKSFNCPKCDVAMEEGYITDLALISYWVKGEPEYSYFRGALKTRGRENYVVTTYRCANCGYLESYAVKEPD